MIGPALAAVLSVLLVAGVVSTSVSGEWWSVRVRKREATPALPSPNVREIIVI